MEYESNVKRFIVLKPKEAFLWVLVAPRAAAIFDGLQPLAVACGFFGQFLFQKITRIIDQFVLWLCYIRCLLNCVHELLHPPVPSRRAERSRP